MFMSSFLCLCAATLTVPMCQLIRSQSHSCWCLLISSSVLILRICRLLQYEITKNGQVNGTYSVNTEKTNINVLCFNLAYFFLYRRGVRHMGPHWFLTVTVLSTALVLPAVTLDTLLCHFCPLQYKGKTCTNLTTQCPPDHLCSSSRGYFGSVHIVSSQGCLSRTLCGSYQILSHRGIEYNASHTCCCGHKCNSKPKSDSSLKKLLGLETQGTDDVSMNHVLRQNSWDSCGNYTTVRNNTVPSVTA